MISIASRIKLLKVDADEDVIDTRRAVIAVEGNNFTNIKVE